MRRSTFVKCLVAVVALVFVFLFGVAENDHLFGPAVASAYGGGEGTIVDPIWVQVNVPRDNSFVNGIGTSYYRFITPATEMFGTYLLAVTNNQQDALLNLYSDPNFSDPVKFCEMWHDVKNDPCIIGLSAGTTYYLEVSAFGFSYDTFTLSVSEITSEGTVASPVELSISQPHSGSVNAAGSSYYRFMPNTSRAHTVSLNNLRSYYGLGPGIKIYASSDFATSILTDCSSLVYSLSCTANELQAGAWYYAEISNKGSDGLYDVTITEGVSEGSVANPIQLTYGTERLCAIDGAASSYYTFTPANTGSTIITAGNTGYFGATVYTNPDFTGALGYCSFNTSPACTVSNVNQGQKYYLRVSNSYNPDLSFTLKLMGGSTEGSKTQPAQLAVSSSAHTASIDARGTAYYRFTSTLSGTYAVTVKSGLTLNWQMYSDPAYSQTVYFLHCISDSTGARVCRTQLNLDNNRDYYLMVQNNTNTAGTYDISVFTGAGDSEGSIKNPVVLIEGAPYSGGRIAYDGYSYYAFTPTTSSPYIIGLVNVKKGDIWGPLSWDLYSDPAFDYSTALSTCYYTTWAGDNICGTNGTDRPAVSLQAGKTYYLQVRNWDFSSDNTYTVTVLPFNTALGCNSGGATCETFESGLPNFNWTPSFSEAPWTVNSTTSGTGTRSLKAGSVPPPHKKSPQPSYVSCFEFTAADVKWIAFSLMKVVDPTGSDYFNIYVDGTMYNTGGWGMWDAYNAPSTPWTRYLLRPVYAGTHTYSWCYSGRSPGTTHGLWVDDVELHY